MTRPDPDSRQTSPAGDSPTGGGQAHGGDLAAAAARFGEPAAGWIDLSTGINPWPYPVDALPPEAWTRLPGAADIVSLRAAAARRYGAPGADRVVPAPGTESLIRLLPCLVPDSCVAVVGPTYGGHAPAWEAAGHVVASLADLPAPSAAPAVVVVTNPNNPDGRCHDPSTLEALAVVQAARGGLLVVDEAFADLTPETSVAGAVDGGGLVVLRSFGKTYGLAGLRLGFAVADRALAGRLAAALGSWPVSGPAIALGTRALADDAWLAAIRARCAEARGRLDGILAAAGLAVVGGTDLFRLVEDARAPAIAAALGRAGLHVRDFARFPDRLRFGLPPDAEAEARLAEALAAATGGRTPDTEHSS
ncbi:MAG: threonine-phosphate decarboxylase CobD [Azospirillaceae bacterium]